jgi:hypothetical protein
VRPFLDDNGQLQPLGTRQEAEERVRQLRHECGKILEQLANPTRINDFGHDRMAYFDWRRAAETKMAQFKSEEQQQLAWLDGFKASAGEKAGLLDEAYKILQDVEVWLDSTPELERLMERLDRHFEGAKVLPMRRAE